MTNLRLWGQFCRQCQVWARRWVGIVATSPETWDARTEWSCSLTCLLCSALSCHWQWVSQCLVTANVWLLRLLLDSVWAGGRCCHAGHAKLSTDHFTLRQRVRVTTIIETSHQQLWLHLLNILNHTISVCKLSESWETYSSTALERNEMADKF